MMRNRNAYRYELICVLLTVLGCTSVHENKPPVETRPDIPGSTVRASESFMAIGKYKNALDTYSGAYDEYRSELRKNYIAAGNKVRTIADAAYKQRNFAEAGSIYHILLTSNIVARDFAPSLTFDTRYLSRRINACSKVFMEIGLVQYREEKLAEAIATWKKALAFDPENKAVIKAVDTARRQLNKLNDLEKQSVTITSR